MKVAVIIFFILVSLLAVGGVQTVGKGGGYGEMQAILANQRMHSFVQVCLTQPKICNLSAEEVARLNRSTSKNFKLEIDPTCQVNPFEILHADHAKVSACELYNQFQPTETPVAKSFKEIASFILMVRIMAHEKLHKTESALLAQKVLSDLAQVEHSLSINVPAGNFIFHFVEVSTPKSFQNLFSIEGNKISVDVSNTVGSAFNCEALTEKPQIQLLNFKNVGEHSAIVELRAEWSCGSNIKYNGLLQIYFETDSAEVVPTSVKARIINKFVR